MSNPATPSDTLWLEVLERAVDDAIDGPSKQEVRDYVFRVRADAVEWIRSDAVEPGSFLWVCNRLAIDAGKVRERLEQRLAKAEENEVNRKARLTVARDIRWAKARRTQGL